MGLLIKFFPALEPYVLAIKLAFILIAAVALIGAGAYGSWYVTRDHYEKILADEHLQQAAAVQNQLIENQKLAAAHAAQITTTETQHAKDQLTLNALRDQLDRVRIHIPIGGCATPGAGQAGADPDRTTGLLSERVDAAFADLQAGVGRLTARCDQLNIDARQANASAQ
jgi:hypothetical protein